MTNLLIFGTISNTIINLKDKFMLTTNRGMVKFFLLSLITFNIYGIVVMSMISSEINQIASPRDGKHTMHYCLI